MVWLYRRLFAFSHNRFPNFTDERNNQYIRYHRTRFRTEEKLMLRQVGMQALVCGAAFVWAGSATAQQPLYTSGHWTESPREAPTMPMSVVPSYGVARASDQVDTGPSAHQTTCSFNAYSHFDETVSRARHDHRPLRHRGKQCNGCGEHSREDGCDFECANCYTRWDVEKRIFMTYSHGNAMGLTTSETYGDSHSAQVGAELLPFIISDNETCYTRWGLMSMFNYVNYEGNRNITLQSRLSGNLLTVDNADTFGLAIGPVLRTDFELFGVRLSPNAAVGLALDWTTIDEIRPQGSITRQVDSFKFASFDAGAYIRMAMDFGITESLNFTVGGDYKLIKTDAMIDNDFRNHFGVVVGFSHEF